MNIQREGDRREETESIEYGREQNKFFCLIFHIFPTLVPTLCLVVHSAPISVTEPDLINRCLCVIVSHREGEWERSKDTVPLECSGFHNPGRIVFFKKRDGERAVLLTCVGRLSL